jgi:hypothetical protein
MKKKEARPRSRLLCSQAALAAAVASTRLAAAARSR